MLPLFGDRLKSELVLLVGGRGLMADLFRHWVTVQN
jgi:hypothetical protein